VFDFRATKLGVALGLCTAVCAGCGPRSGAQRGGSCLGPSFGQRDSALIRSLRDKLSGPLGDREAPIQVEPTFRRAALLSASSRAVRCYEQRLQRLRSQKELFLAVAEYAELRFFRATLGGVTSRRKWAQICRLYSRLIRMRRPHELLEGSWMLARNYAVSARTRCWLRSHPLPKRHPIPLLKGWMSQLKRSGTERCRMPALPKIKPLSPLYREIVRDLVEHIRLLKGGPESRQLKHYVADVYWRSHRYRQANTIYRFLLEYPEPRDDLKGLALRTIAFAILIQRFAAAVNLASKYLVRFEMGSVPGFRRQILALKSLAERQLRECSQNSVKARRARPSK